MNFNAWIIFARSIQQDNGETGKKWIEFEKFHVHQQEDCGRHLRGYKFNIVSRCIGKWQHFAFLIYKWLALKFFIVQSYIVPHSLSPANFSEFRRFLFCKPLAKLNCKCIQTAVHDNKTLPALCYVFLMCS